MPMALDRSDQQLRSRIINQLEYSRELDAHDIGVVAEDGRVTLVGTVETYPEKLAAEEAIKRLYGVRAIDNDLRVRGASPSDADLESTLNEALRARISVPRTVHASVSNGHVTLIGTVPWLFQRFAAEVSIAYMPGVKGLVNHIQIGSDTAPRDVRAQVERALTRVAGLDWKRIVVDATEGVITLTGSVHSLLERDEAERAAWGTPGVVDVDNQLEVVARRWW